MVKLVIPCKDYLASYIEAREEYTKNKVSTYRFSDPAACDIFEKFENYRLERNLPSNRVGEDKYWLVEEDTKYFIGEISIRHKLNDALMLRGGHIGYGVRFSEWNKGYGTLMLSLALKKAKELKLERVLITCNDDNYASAKVMEKNGFILADKVNVEEDGIMFLTRRYWKTLQ